MDSLWLGEGVVSYRWANCPDLPSSWAPSNSHSFPSSVFFAPSAASQQPQPQQQWPCDVLYNQLIAADSPDRHGRRLQGGGGGQAPRIWRRDANANCPPQILSYRYKKNRSVAFKIRQNPFLDGAVLMLSSRRSPRPLSWGGNTPPIPHPTRHQPIFGTRHASPRIPAISIRLQREQRRRPPIVGNLCEKLQD